MKQFNYIYVDVKKFNKLLKFAKESYIIILDSQKGKLIGRNAYINEKTISIELTMHYRVDGNDEIVTFIAYKDGREVIPSVSPIVAWTTFNHYYKVPRMTIDKFESPFSAAPILYFNKERNATRTSNCYGYDINSAYTYAMLNAKLPDTSTPLPSGIVQENEIGYDLNGRLVQTGNYGHFRFKELNQKDRQAIAKFALTWYNKKKNAKTPEEKAKAKGILNYSIGYMQQYNSFLRTAIIEWCNNRIRAIIDKYGDHVLYANTDSIVSDIELPLELADDIGKWKIEHKGDFAYKEFNYQWNEDCPSYRGVAKSWFKEKYDLLKDGVPIINNSYYFDTKKLQLLKA